MKPTPKNNVRAVVMAAIALTLATRTFAAPVADPSPWETIGGQLLADAPTPADPSNSEVWFPQFDVSEAAPAQSHIASEPPSHLIARNERTVIPLPAPAWTGLTGLVGLACLRTRKLLRRLMH
jgi:hypothetical protein